MAHTERALGAFSPGTAIAASAFLMTTTPIKLSSPLTWIDGPKLGRKKRRATIAPQVWENHYLRIEQLYRAEDRPLKYVAQYMKDNHGFDAT